jgi:uncharacterized protein YaeQ
MRDLSRSMALPSTLHHLDLRVAHADRGLEATAAVKVARHPSESLERLWLRIVAFAWQWTEGIAFGPGLCEPDEPDVGAALPDGRRALVVRVGTPAPGRVDRDLRANGGARVAVLFESPRRLSAFMEEARGQGITRIAAADLAAIDPPLLAALALRDERRIRAGFTFVEGHVYVDVGGETLDGPLHRTGA